MKWDGPRRRATVLAIASAGSGFATCVGLFLWLDSTAFLSATDPRLLGLPGFALGIVSSGIYAVAGRCSARGAMNVSMLATAAVASLLFIVILVDGGSEVVLAAPGVLVWVVWVVAILVGLPGAAGALLGFGLGWLLRKYLPHAVTGAY